MAEPSPGAPFYPFHHTTPQPASTHTHATPLIHKHITHTIPNTKTTSTTQIKQLNITNGTLNSSLTLNLQLGNLTMSNSLATFGAGFGFDGGGASILNLTNSSSWQSQFLTNGTTVNVDGTSSLSLAGGGDPINSQTAATRVNLALGAQLTLASFSEFAEQGNEIFVNGVSYNSNNSILSFNGNTATAVPEPAPLAMLGVCVLFLLRRRSNDRAA